jgi:hypothetical protein
LAATATGVDVASIDRAHGGTATRGDASVRARVVVVVVVLVVVVVVVVSRWDANGGDARAVRRLERGRGRA